MNPTRRPMVAGNWKMYKTVAQAQAFVEVLAKTFAGQSFQSLPSDVVICPPYTALDALSKSLKQTLPGIGLGAQNMAAADEGAYTGEIAPGMLLELGVTHVILGHSERRQYFNETDKGVNEKTIKALSIGLTPIVCVGESLQQREAGETDAWVSQQVKAALANINPADVRKLVFAYEPIWAIGTGKVCEADEANRVCALIRGLLPTPATRILYGGSVKPDNVVGLMQQSDIDGGLVGGASLEPASFAQLIQATLPVTV